MWKKSRIGTECRVGDGAHASIQRREIGKLYLSAKNFTFQGLRLKDVTYISLEDFNKYFNPNSKALTKPESGDLLLGIIGAGLGVPYLVEKKLEEFGISSSVAIIRATNKNINSKYLYYWMIGSYFQKYLKSIQGGSAQGFLSLEMIRFLPLNYPELQTQKKIANILSAYDDLIENNNQRIQLLEEMAAEIYKEWFVRFRFPGYESATFVDKEGKEVSHGTDGALPLGWEKIKFRNCLSHYIGGGWGTDIPTGKSIVPAHVIRGTDIPNLRKGQLNYNVLRFHTESNLSNRRCIPNDIIFEVSGGTEEQSLGRTVFITQGILDRFGDDVIGASFCKLLRINQDIISPFYINALLNRMYCTGELKVFQVQSTGISNYQFEDFIDSTKVLKPVKNITEQFDKTVATIVDEIQLLGAKNETLQETRDLLLPRLISGKLSVENLSLSDIEAASMVDS